MVARDVPTLVARGAIVQAEGDSVADGLLVAEHGRVTYVGPVTRAPPVADDAVEVPVGQGVVVPGLVDAHVHLTCDGGPDLAAEVEGLGGAALAVKAAANALRTLHAGIVAVRDLGAPCGAAIEIGRATAGGRLPGPDVAASGRVLTAPGGHIPYLGRVEAGPDAMAAAAREELAAGAAGVKLVATGGILTPGVPVGNVAYEQDELAAACAVAREAGAWAAAHVIGLEGTKRAIRAGATSLEHAVFLDDEAVALARGAGTVVVPTLLPLLRIIERGRDGGVAPELVDKAESVAETHLASTRRAVREGLPIAVGTDAGTPFNPHGGAALEARLLVEHAGLDPMGALRALTVTAARCLGHEELGRLAPGVAASFTVLGADPREGPHALADVRQVVVRGRAFSREALANLLPP